MPPVFLKPPKPVHIRVPHGEIPRLSGPEIKMGKSLIPTQPLRITADQLDDARKTMRRVLGKFREFRMNVHATFPVCERPQGVKRGQGRGPIHHHVARVPAGRSIFQIPTMTTLPTVESAVNWAAFRSVAMTLPAKFKFRDQTNNFAMDRIRADIPARLQRVARPLPSSSPK
jgi:ESCRT-II complex subunit VPS22